MYPLLSKVDIFHILSWSWHIYSQKDLLNWALTRKCIQVQSSIPNFPKAQRFSDSERNNAWFKTVQVVINRWWDLAKNLREKEWMGLKSEIVKIVSLESVTYNSKTWGCKLEIGVCKNLVLEVDVPSNNPLALLICKLIPNISHFLHGSVLGESGFSHTCLSYLLALPTISISGKLFISITYL
jgi:hypothetical protein